MQEQKQHESSNQANDNDDTRERRTSERRTSHSEGYACISIVGWIDRREKNRRTDDTCVW